MRAAAVSCLLAFGIAHAETTPVPGAIDARVRVVAYNPEDVIELHGVVGNSIHLQLAEGEKVVGLAAGRNSRINVIDEGNHVFLKPTRSAEQEKEPLRFTTNMTLLTDRRTYHFEYSVTETPLRGQLIYSLRFTYPQDEAKAAAAKAETARVNARMNKPSDRPQNRDYWFCGEKTMQPEEAYDDGVQTHLRFQPRAEFPALFVQNDDGSEALLNFNVNGDDVVIHKVARRLVLRRGALVGCVVNKSFDGGGARLPSNAVAPGIERVIKEAP